MPRPGAIGPTSATGYTPGVEEHSHAERMPQRIELSAEELALLLGADRFAPAPPEDRDPRPATPTLSGPEKAIVAAAIEAAAQDMRDAGLLPPDNGADAPVASIAPIARAAEAAPTSDAAEPAPADALTPPSGAPRTIGDTDLVQAVTAGAPNFEQLALRAVRERTGEDLARIVAGATADAMVATGTATPIGGGRAFVAPIAPDARHAWALWLARWLELAALARDRAPRGLWDDATGFPAWARLRTQAAHRIAAARMRREPVFVGILRVVDVELWNRRSQILVDDAFLARVATALDAAVAPGDELARLDDGAFVVVSGRESATTELARAIRAEVARLPGDGPRSLAVDAGCAAAPWEATDPDALLEIAVRRAADASNGR